MRGFAEKLSNRREIAIAKQALKIAGNPETILDIPCGTGRFWPMLAESPQRKIYAADLSDDMLQIGLKCRPPVITRQINAFIASIFDIPLTDNFVENIFCMRFLHHVGQPELRCQVLQELHRVARDSICISLWVDGNFKAYRRKQLEQKRQSRVVPNRFVLPRWQIEEEFRACGFRIIDCIDLIPFYSMWSIYVLRVS